MTKEELKTEIRKYLKDDEFLTKNGVISKNKLKNKITKFPYNIVREIDTIISLDWDNISGYQKLSENFIREFQDKVD